MVMTKSCILCGKENTLQYSGCRSCYDKLINRPHELFSDYLDGGYFQEVPIDDAGTALKRVIRPEIFKEEAERVAKILNLAKQEWGMKNDREFKQIINVSKSGLFKFYARLLTIYNASKRKQTFEEVVSDLNNFAMAVKYAVGKKTVPTLLDEFISRNIALAVKGPEELAAFKAHFESVVAYFTYLRKDEAE